MSQPIISVCGIGKRYKLGATHGGRGYKTLRDALARGIHAPVRLFSKNANNPTNNSPENNSFWALKDVSFDVQPGEVLGIIGRNGAGKSTMLKILSQITDPTEGEIHLFGRVASLLEVGTGFHPELSGKENIYLNGAILGMTRVEIKKKFDEIVAFAEVEKFLDTPVKRYSSGMYVRLAFAVAAHLESEILLIDEVLAVGDYQFQKKCLGKMGEVSREGRTVILVSHNMAHLLNLCQRAVLLEKGVVKKEGPAREIVGEYLAGKASQMGEVIWDDPKDAPGGDMVRLHALRILDGREQPVADVDICQGCAVEIAYWNLLPGARLNCTIQLLDYMGSMVLSTHNLPSMILDMDPWAGQPMPKGLFTSRCQIPKDFLNEGRYSINVYIQRDVNLNQYLAYKEDAISFTAYDSGEMRKEYAGGWGGVVRPRLSWKTTLITNETK